LSGSSIEQASLAFLGPFLSSDLVRGLVLLLGSGRAEFIHNPIERIVEHSEKQGASVNYSRRSGLHAPPTRNPLYVR
jgi:hypothetical protein